MYIKQILAKKDRKVLSVEPETLVMDVVKFMTKYDIGSVIILGEGKLKGIFTERDVLHLSAELGLDLFKKIGFRSNDNFHYHDDSGRRCR